jgi:hypothetical protein
VIKLIRQPMRCFRSLLGARGERQGSPETAESDI